VRRCPPEERARVADALAVALAGEPFVEFAYLHGSFMEDGPFHDIDIAVMLGEDAASDVTARRSTSRIVWSESSNFPSTFVR
jgi:predicted nucleotidyltransferase